MHERVNESVVKMMFYPVGPAGHREKKGKCHETWNET